LVIFGHSSALSPNLPIHYKDFFYNIFGVYSSSIAVYIFFFLSGLLVTNSLIINKNIISFFISRFFRIYPALFILIIFSIFVGSFFSSLGFFDYFNNLTTFKYFYNNILLKTQFNLPGVFENVKFPGIINGSLWTIKYEIISYLFLGLFYISGVFNRFFSILVLVFILFDYLKITNFLFLNPGPEPYLALYFCFGVCLAHFKDFLFITPKFFFVLPFLLFYSKGSILNELLNHIFFFIFILILSSSKFILKFKPKIDISYGVYLYSFPVAQALCFLFPSYNFYFHLFFTFILSFFFAFISSLFIEIPMIRFGKKISSNFNFKF
jgi:peptidoglycan/LPS O-acetylase OafA/YrhL